jgi:hypothetical protein
MHLQRNCFAPSPFEIEADMLARQKAFFAYHEACSTSFGLGTAIVRRSSETTNIETSEGSSPSPYCSSIPSPSVRHQASKCLRAYCATHSHTVVLLNGTGLRAELRLLAFNQKPWGVVVFCWLVLSQKAELAY